MSELINMIRDFVAVDYITPREMQEAEQRSISRGVTVETLMENAGRAVADEVEKRYPPLSGKRIVVLAGSGNNGGDGMVAARYLSGTGASVVVLLLGEPERIKTQEARLNWQRLEGSRVKKIVVGDRELLLQHSNLVWNADIVVDAIFGTGVKGEVREPSAEAIRMINRSKGIKIAVDIPTGIDPLTGESTNVAVKADLTLTLHRAKVGLKGREKYTGELVVLPIGIVEEPS